MAKILDGKSLAQDIRKALALEVAQLKKNGLVPGIAVVIAGDNAASKIYVKNKRKACDETGIASFEYNFPESAPQSQIEELINKLNSDEKVNGILVQLPLPTHIDEQAVIETIDPKKDVDGFHPVNMGRLLIGLPGLRPCTPLGIMALIDSIGYKLAGKQAVVVGRSRIVGKPAALLLLERDATVTVCHSRTKNLPEIISSADVLVAAVGSPHFIDGSLIKEGAVVIDVGINRTDDGSIVGDIDFDEASKRAFAITPVPGGVGPMTIAMLLRNTVEAAKSTLLK